MTLAHLSPTELALSIAPESLGFADTSELLQQPLPWIGQARSQTAARFVLTMAQPDYNLFVLGEVGSGRSSLLQLLMQEVGAT
jgi:type IV secretory pathway VirB4 component